MNPVTNDDESDVEEEKQGAVMARRSRTKQASSAQSSSSSSSSSLSIGKMTVRNTRSTTAAAIVAGKKATNTKNESKKRKQQKRRRQHENDPDTPYRPYSYIAKSYPNDKSMQAFKKQKREQLGNSEAPVPTITSHCGDDYEHKQSDLDVEMRNVGATAAKYKPRKYKSKKKRRILFQVCDRDALSHIYSYLTRIEFATVILVSRHWNRIGSMRSCWPPYTRETILHRYVNSIVGAGEYDDSVLHPRRLEPKGIFDLQRLIRTGGTYSQVNDLAFDEEYYANPSPLIELTKLKNLTSLRYTIMDCSQLNLLEPFAEVMSHQLLVLSLIINRETEEDESDHEYKDRMKRYDSQFVPIGFLTSLRVLVTNTLPPDSILVKLHSLELLHCPTDCWLHPYTARVIRYLSVRHQLRHVSLGGNFDNTTNRPGGRGTFAANFIGNLCVRPWKDTLTLLKEVEEEENEEEQEGEQVDGQSIPPPRHILCPWYVDPIPMEDVNSDLPTAQLTSLWLGNSHELTNNHSLDLSVRDFLSLFSMSTLRHLRCQVESRRSLFSVFAASNVSSSIAAVKLESLDLNVGPGDFSGLSTFTQLHTLRLTFTSRSRDPIDLSVALPHLTRLRDLSFMVESYVTIAPATWESMHHLHQLRCLTFLQGHYPATLFEEMLKQVAVHLARIPQLEEVHWREQLYWYRSAHDKFVILPPELLTAISSSSTWNLLCYHPRERSDSESSGSILMHPKFVNALTLLTPEMTSDPRIQQFRLHLFDPREKLQSISRVAMNGDGFVERELGWTKEVDNYDSDEEIHEDDEWSRMKACIW